MAAVKHLGPLDSQRRPSRLVSLPDEILRSILFHLPPPALATILQISKRLNLLAQDPAVWRHHCLTYYEYWDKSHKIQQKFADPVSSTDWKGLFLSRRSIDIKTSLLLNSILESQTGRIGKFEEIISQGYDAKDALIRHTRAGKDVPDVLARRYYSNAVLGYLQRSLAIDVWLDLVNGRCDLLEHALGAFDMFVIRDGEGDLDHISNSLDGVASLFQLEHPEEKELTVRARAMALAGFLRRKNLTGGVTESSYRDLQNNFIGFALRDEHHPSLPLISVAIFCCLAKRIGLDAQPCGFPFHVLAIVQSPPALTLDGRPSADNQASESMYLDPFQSDQEVSVAQLHRQLDDLGVSHSAHSTYLGPSSATEITLRAERNIMHSVATESERNATRDAGIPVFYLESALYSALWASMILDVPARGNGPAALNVQRRQYLPYLRHNFETHFPEDVSRVEQHILPMFQGLPQFSELRDAIDVTRAADRIPKQPKPREEEATRQRVPFRVGQVFRHKRYGYTAVITGWDVKCEADERWVQAMGVDSLSGGRWQSFYHVLVEDKSVRYVAAENIEIISRQDPSSTMLQLAGKHFKRWDSATHAFVSNVRDEYPDD